MSSRMSIRALHSYLAVPLYVPEEEVNVGRALFHNFVHDEFQSQGLSDDAVIDNTNDDILREHLAMAQNFAFGQVGDEADAIQAGVQTIVVRTIGSNIRNIANEFAESRQRPKIREHAYAVNLSDLTFDGFWALLDEVFKHGINVYNIVALFYFCSDILIRAVKLELARIGMNLFKWALKYISEKVCEWVYKNGGWEKAIKKVITTKYVAYGTAIVVISVALGWGLYKGLKS